MRLRILAMSALFTLSLAACGGNILAEAEAKSKAACECKDADCVRPHVKWFNEQALKDGGAALKGLSADEAAKFTAFSLAAGECQMKIKSGAAAK